PRRRQLRAPARGGDDLRGARTHDDHGDAPAPRAVHAHPPLLYCQSRGTQETLPGWGWRVPGDIARRPPPAGGAELHPADTRGTRERAVAALRRQPGDLTLAVDGEGSARADRAAGRTRLRCRLPATGLAGLGAQLREFVGFRLRRQASPKSTAIFRRPWANLQRQSRQLLPGDSQFLRNTRCDTACVTVGLIRVVLGPPIPRIPDREPVNWRGWLAGTQLIVERTEVGCPPDAVVVPRQPGPISVAIVMQIGAVAGFPITPGRQKRTRVIVQSDPLCGCRCPGLDVGKPGADQEGTVAREQPVLQVHQSQPAA